jgi:hypothetical protein
MRKEMLKILTAALVLAGSMSTMMKPGHVGAEPATQATKARQSEREERKRGAADVRERTAEYQN